MTPDICVPLPLLELSISKSRIPLTLKAPMDARQIAPAMRGQLGFALKKRFCPFDDFREKPCPPCPDAAHCLYPRLFAPLSPSGATPPRPYVLSLLPPGKPRLEPGETAILELTLMGEEAIKYRTAMETALTTAGRELDTLSPASPPGPHPFENTDSGNGLPLFQWIQALPPLPPGEITEFRFHSPIQLKRTLKAVTFPALVKTIIARLRDLRRFYHPSNHMGRFPPAFYDAARTITVFSDLKHTRFDIASPRGNRTLHLGGMEGNLIFKGNLAPFSPLLAAGFLLGMGQKTVYGLGQFDTPAWACRGD